MEEELIARRNHRRPKEQGRRQGRAAYRNWEWVRRYSSATPRPGAAIILDLLDQVRFVAGAQATLHFP
jgi:hypothetical protein